MDKSVFTDKSKKPTEKDLIASLSGCYDLWETISLTVHKKLPSAKSEWNFPGEKYGWSFRIKDAKRVIIYLLPREKFFKVAFVFGQKAYDAIMSSNISDQIKKELKIAKIYAEGRGIRIDIKNRRILKDIIQLIEFKLSN